MKKLAHNLNFSLAILLFLSTLSVSAKRSGTEKSKEIKENYTLTPNHRILVDNRFGEVNINSWESNKMELDIKIKVKDGNEKRAQQLLDRIKIDIVKTDNKFSVKTIIDGNDKDLEIKVKNNGYLKINYNLKVPVNNMLEVRNSFGPIVIDRMNASVKVDLKFGAATIGELNGDQNDLSFDFCDPAVISKLYKGKIDLNFSKLELLESEDLTLTTEMSGSKVEKVKKIQCYLKFGSLDINEVKDLTLESQMSAVKIESLHNSGKVENKYGALTIANVKKVCTQLDINGEFSPIKITLEKGGNYNINANSKMSGIKLPEGSIENEKPAQTSSPAIKTSSNFSGRIGQKDDNAPTLNITSSFGEIKLMLAN